MSKVGKRLIDAAKEARQIAKGVRDPASKYIPADINVRAIRRKLELSQDDFASRFGFSVNQIRDWEQQRTRPLGGVRAYLMLIDRAPEQVLALLAKLKQHQRSAA
jgi:putative transcriptional regulator